MYKNTFFRKQATLFLVPFSSCRPDFLWWLWSCRLSFTWVWEEDDFRTSSRPTEETTKKERKTLKITKFLASMMICRPRMIQLWSATFKNVKNNTTQKLLIHLKHKVSLQLVYTSCCLRNLLLCTLIVNIYIDDDVVFPICFFAQR